jgi:alkylation response protein AidB-like acyl-CoA dehydrogenase
MIFSFSDEQRMLADTAQRFAAEHGAVQPSAGDARARGDVAWRQMAELGWLGIGIPEQDGGIGGGPVETAIVMDAVGRSLADVPLLSTVVIAGATLARFGGAAQTKKLLPGIVEGRTRIATAFGEAAARYDLFDVETIVRCGAGSFVLEGQKLAVLDAADADYLLVSARSDSGRRNAAELATFLVPVTAPGVTRDSYPTYDGRIACDVVLSGVPVPEQDLLGVSGQGTEIVQWATERAIAALCAEAVGVMSGAFDMTLDYLKSRRQFGRMIGGFQALQHRMADLFAGIEEARSLALAAAWALQSGSDARRAVAAAKIHVGRVGRQVADECIQMHGAIAMTDDYGVGRYAKRLLAIDTLFGDADYHLGRFPLHAEQANEGGLQ